MRCAQCYRPIRPVAVFDIDGTLADYHKTFASFAWQYHGLRRREFGSWNGAGEFEEWLGLTKAQYREAKLAYRQGGNKRWLPMYPGAKEIIDGLRSRRCDVWIATTRPWQRLDNIDPDTREWLRRNDLAVDGLLFGDDKYRQLVEAVDPLSIIGVVDDLPEMYDVAESLGLPVILRANHHNEATRGEGRLCGTLQECGVWVRQRLDRWQARNEKIGGA